MVVTARLTGSVGFGIQVRGYRVEIQKETARLMVLVLSLAV
jgi:hypothetical protein